MLSEARGDSSCTSATSATRTRARRVAVMAATLQRLGATPREEAEEFDAFAQPPLQYGTVAQHLSADREDLPRTKVEAPVEGLDGREDLRTRQVRIPENARLHAGAVDESLVRQPALLLRLPVQRRPRVRGRKRHLQRVGIDVLRETDGLFDRLAGLARQAHDEGAVDRDAEGTRVARELARAVDANALLDVVQDGLAARFVAHEQQAQPVVAKHLQAGVGDVRLGVARPCHAELAQSARDRLRARQVVGEGIVVEEVLLDLREMALRARDLRDDVLDGAGAIALAADRLRPQAERTLGA